MLPVTKFVCPRCEEVKDLTSAHLVSDDKDEPEYWCDECHRELF